MRTTTSDLPILFEAGPAVIRGADSEGWKALFISLPGGADIAPLLKGLSGDRCQCPHRGYVRKGTMQIIYADGAETCTAGDLYYMPPGHTLVAEEDLELIEFSPIDEYDEVLATVRQNAGVGVS